MKCDIAQCSIFQHIEEGRKLVLEQVIVSLASVADTAESQFADYYDRYVCLCYITMTGTSVCAILL